MWWRNWTTLGLRENTLILFSGDNGTASQITSPFQGTMRHGGKGSRRMIDANVPLIANWPRTIAPGGTCDDLIDFSDVYPTLAEVCGRYDQEAGLDGRSFLPQALRGSVVPESDARRGGKRPPETTPRDWVVSYFKGRDRGPNKNPGFFWIGNHEWKLDHTGKLYHVADDPLEANPIRLADDTPESAVARREFDAALGRLGIDCRNLWVYVDTKGIPRTRANTKVRLYGKARWRE